MPDLLAEASALSERTFGADPIAEVKAEGLDLQMLKPAYEPAPEPSLSEPDPEPGKLYEVNVTALQAHLATRAPELVAEVGSEVISMGSVTMRALPRDVVGVLDQELGAFSAPATWELLAELGEDLVMSEGQPSGPRQEFTPSRLEAYANATPALAVYVNDMLRNDPGAFANLAVTLNSLPPRVLASLERHQNRPELWELGSTIGSKLWGFQLRKPRTSQARR